MYCLPASGSRNITLEVAGGLRMVREWGLPKVLTHIRLDREELLVLDWHLSGHYLCNCARGLDIGEIIGTWHEFRAAVWDGIRALSDPKNPGILLPPAVGKGTPQYDLAMDESTAKYFFNWLPTTFMWGTGRDCGYTLKVKMHCFLRGEEEIESDNPNTTESDPKDRADTDP